MGNLYVWLDRRVEYTEEEVSVVLGVPIDDDLKISSRYELCRRVEETFGIPKESFWQFAKHTEDSFCRSTGKKLTERGCQWTMTALV